MCPIICEPGDTVGSKFGNVFSQSDSDSEDFKHDLCGALFTGNG